MSTAPDLEKLAAELADTADRTAFSGVAVVHRNGSPVFELASGWADRAERRPIEPETKMATASATKGFTALAMASLIEEGRCGWDTPLSDVVGDALPAVDAGVTLRQLLGHTSGAGDYLDEDELGDVDDPVLDAFGTSAHRLEGPTDFLPILNRFPHRETPGTRFRYNNGGYVVLALAIERLGDEPYHAEVRRRVFEPAGMTSTDFLRSDRLPAGTALGYLRDGRTNVFHLPVVGTGDGGAYTTAPDMLRFWDALLAGAIVGTDLVAEMTAVHNEGGDGRFYGLGFWIGRDRVTAQLEGMDAGVSMRTGTNPTSATTWCVIANDSDGAWPLVEVVDRHLVGPASGS